MSAPLVTPLRRDVSHRGGNTTFAFALSLMAMAGSVGGAIDLNNYYSVKAKLQDAMDASVLGGLRQETSQRSTVATRIFASNLPEGLSATPGYTTDKTTLTGTVAYNNRTGLLGLFGISSLTINVTATAVGTAASQSSGPCIQVLDPSGSQALLVNSGAKITAPNCEIQVRSKGSPAAIFNSGSSLNFKKVCIEGSNVIRNSTAVDRLSLSCPTVADQWAALIPTVASTTCTVSNGNCNTSSVSLSPGVYCGWFNFNNSSATVSFAPGLYVIRSGGWNVNGGTWTGKGVTFYFEDTTKIQFNSGISADLTAPDTGTYKNLLFFERPGLSNTDFIFNSAVANHMDGVIWLPSRNVTFNAQSKMSSDKLSMVMNRLILNNTTWNLEPVTGSSGTGGALTNIRLLK
ncbi:TadE/TadG family type IV pilus assembly protein [Asticcacaulis sp. W401b]|uniref:TadE/TadG family type IV pilus assembly protein n=1 Tax=Asticcacaulis sp. W401b TaxID=3388666 RepID=UPI003970D0FB